MNCDCYFCGKGILHPASHDEFHRISDRLLVAESLRPEDRVKTFACQTCGHLEFGMVPWYVSDIQ